MRRLKCEKETIILTNEDDGFYDVYTFNQSLQKRLRTFAEKYPDDCWFLQCLDCFFLCVLLEDSSDSQLVFFQVYVSHRLISPLFFFGIGFICIFSSFSFFSSLILFSLSTFLLDSKGFSTFGCFSAIYFSTRPIAFCT